MTDRSSAFAVRLAGLRAGVWVDLARQLGRLADAIERLSNALHARAMENYRAVLAAADEDERGQT